MDQYEFGGRKAPYAPVSALQEFFARMQGINAPGRVDRRFLQKLNVASNNEWALLSALKFLGIVDDTGQPTSSYRALQATDRFESVLRDLVFKAYKPLFDTGGERMSAQDLINYFRVASSPSQAKNAARFFREVCHLAGIGRPQAPILPFDRQREAPESREPEPILPAGADQVLLNSKLELLSKLPAPRPEWSATDYRAICEAFVQMLAHLDATSAVRHS